MNQIENNDIKMKEEKTSTQINSLISKLFEFNTINIFPSKDEQIPKQEINFITTKRGRKNKNDDIKYESDKRVHSKFSNDNVRRRIKVYFNKYIITLLNTLLKRKFRPNKMKFVKMDIRVSKDIGIEYNRKLLNSKIMDIIVYVSNKYQNKGNNRDCLNYIQNRKDNDEILEILNMTYKDLYTDYYLKSTKNNSPDNSLEKDKEILLKLYGNEYLDKFNKVSQNFVEFFINGKQRKSKKCKEIKEIKIPLENELIETLSTNNEIINNKEQWNNHMKVNMVSVSTQTDIYDINAKLIAFS